MAGPGLSVIRKVALAALVLTGVCSSPVPKERRASMTFMAWFRYGGQRYRVIS